MKSKEQLIEEYSALIPFVESLSQLDDDKWASPIEEGKWTTRDVIAHIMLWDKYFFEGGISKITNNENVTVQHLNFDEFNRQAVEYAITKDKQEIIETTIHYRKELLHHLSLIPDSEFAKDHIDGDGKKFSAYKFIKGFIPHDKKHIKQLKAFLAK